MVIDISVLSPTRPFPARSYADLLERLPVGSGVVVHAGRRRATFLPAVPPIYERLAKAAAAKKVSLRGIRFSNSGPLSLPDYLALGPRQSLLCPPPR